MHSLIKNTDDLKKLIPSFQYIYIYGIGKAGKYVLKMLAEIGSTQKLGFIVSKRKLNEKESYFGLPLFSIDEFSCLEKDKYIVIIPPSEFKDELIANCHKYNFNFAVVGVNSENKENSLKDYNLLNSFLSISTEDSKNSPLDKISNGVNQIIKKLSMVDNIWRIGNEQFYVPNYPGDFIQSHIVDNNEYFEQETLRELEPYIFNNATILDLGANIGNHTVYFATHCNVSHIYSFEPVKSTFDILKKNISINNLYNVTPYNVGASDRQENGIFEIYDNLNIGNSHLSGIVDICEKDDAIKLVKLDDFLFDKLEKLDFVKIDVEDYEYNALLGMKKILAKFSPIIFIEIMPDFYQKDNSLLESYGYRQVRRFSHHNYLYQKL